MEIIDEDDELVYINRPIWLVDPLWDLRQQKPNTSKYNWLKDFILDQYGRFWSGVPRSMESQAVMLVIDQISEVSSCLNCVLDKMPVTFGELLKLEKLLDEKRQQCH